MKAKAPLYRKVNTKARGVCHRRGGDYKERRNTKGEQGSDRRRGGMARGVRRGLDYTPLFRFLLSKVGEDWDEVRREAESRLDRPDPIYWMVAVRDEDARGYVRISENSYYSGLRVDDDNRLVRVDPSLGPESLAPACACCTHTFNGVRFTQAYRP